MDLDRIVSDPLTRPAMVQSGSGLITPTPQGETGRLSHRVREMERDLRGGRRQFDPRLATPVYAGISGPLTVNTRTNPGVAHRDSQLKYLWVGIDQVASANPTTIQFWLAGALTYTLTMAAGVNKADLYVVDGLQAFVTRWYWRISAVGTGAQHLTCVAVYE